MIVPRVSEFSRAWQCQGSVSSVRHDSAKDQCVQLGMMVVASLVFGKLSLQALGTVGPLSVLCGMRQLLGSYLPSQAPLGSAGEGCTTPLPTPPVVQHTSTEWPLHQWTPCVHVLSHALFQLQWITPQQICIYMYECTFCISLYCHLLCVNHTGTHLYKEFCILCMSVYYYCYVLCETALT